MSSESPDIESLAQARRNKAAEMFQAAQDKHKQKTKDDSFWKMSRELYRDTCAAYSVDKATVSKFWRNNYNPKAPELFRKSSEGMAMRHVYACHHKCAPNTFLDQLRKSTFTDGQVWSFFVKCVNLSENPVVLFRVGQTSWVLYPTSVGPTAQFLVPRIWIPVEKHNDVLLVPAAQFVEEYK